MITSETDRGSGDDPVKRRDGLILRKVQQDLLLLDTEFNQIHQLNETASFIWENWEQVPDPLGLRDCSRRSLT